MLNITTIDNFEENENFQIDNLNRIINSNSLHHIHDNIYHYNKSDIIFENNNALGENIIAERILCDIKTFFTSEPIEFYSCISSNSIDINSKLICIPSSAYKINDNFSAIHESMVLFYYNDKQEIIEGRDFCLLIADTNIFNTAINSGTNKDGIRYHFKESQYIMKINDQLMHIVNKKDVLFCES